jgi:peptidyl-tRNA hydrolase, PTH1 family
MSHWLVVGLGNPGPRFAKNRHNLGFLVADELASRASASFRAPLGMRAEVAETRLGLPGQPAAPRLTLVKPRTYMNDTGAAVKKLLTWFKLTPDQLVAIHDELDIDPGQIRVKFGGGDNGHNGLRSMRSALGSGDFFRVRVGIGRPPGRQDPADFLLSDFSAGERDALAPEVARAADAVESLVLDGLEKTQTRFNS